MLLVVRCTLYLLLFSLALNVKTVFAAQDIAALEKPASAETPQLSDKLGDPLPENAIMRLGTKRLVHQGGGPSMIVLSKDEQTIFSACTRWMMAWSTESGKLLWQKPRKSPNAGVEVGAAGYGIRTMAIMPDTGEVVSSGADGSLGFWNPETGALRTVESPAESYWKSVDISPDSKLIAIGGSTSTWVCEPEGTLRYVIENNPKAPIEINRFNGRDRLRFGGDFSYARFSPDGKVLALVNSEKQKAIQLFEASTGKPIREVETTGNVVRMDFSPDSSRIVATERDNAARLYDIETATQVWQFVIPAPPNIESYTSTVAFGPDGKQIAVGAPIGSDNRIRILSSADGKEQGILSGCGWKPWPMQFTRDSKFLYGSGWSANIHKWDVDTFEEEPLPGGAVRAYGVCATSGDGKHLVFVTRNGIHVLDIDSGDIARTFQLDDVREYGQVTFNHDGSQLAVGYASESELNVVIWDIESEKEIHRWNWGKGRDLHSSVEALAFSRNGKKIAAAVFRQGAAFVFDLPTDAKIFQVKHREVYGLDISKDGSTLYTTGWDKFVRSWKIRTETEISSLNVVGTEGNNDTRAYGLKLSNDQKLIATCDMTANVRLFDVELAPISVIPDTGGFSYGTLAISHHDLWLGVGAHDGVKVFDIASGQQVFHEKGHDGDIYNVDFGARGKTLISGGSDGVCYLWDIVPSFKPEDSVANAGSFDALVGFDGVAAFDAYMKLSQQPDATLELLKKQLGELVAQKFDDNQVAKWIDGVGSDSPDQHAKASAKLFEFGPAIDGQLAKSLEGKLSDSKREAIILLRHRIHRCYRRATSLLAELENSQAESVIDELLKKSKTKKWKLMVFEAKKNRKQ